MERKRNFVWSSVGKKPVAVMQNLVSHFLHLKKICTKSFSDFFYLRLNGKLLVTTEFEKNYSYIYPKLSIDFSRIIRRIDIILDLEFKTLKISSK